MHVMCMCACVRQRCMCETCTCTCACTCTCHVHVHVHAPVSELKGQTSSRSAFHSAFSFTYQTSISSGELLALQWEIRRGSLPYLNLATWPLLAGGWPEIEWQGWPYGATLLFWEKVVYDLTHVFRMNQRYPQSPHTPHTRRQWKPDREITQTHRGLLL